MAAFLRVINALENIKVFCRPGEPRKGRDQLLAGAGKLCKAPIAELDDAIEVLDCAGLHPEAQRKLLAAAAIDALALITSHQGTRNALIENQAIALKNSAKNDMVN